MNYLVSRSLQSHLEGIEGELIHGEPMNRHTSWHVRGAQFSSKYPNFIVNRGDASAADIEALIEYAQQRVLEQTGVRLRMEVRIVGRSGLRSRPKVEQYDA